MVTGKSSARMRQRWVVIALIALGSIVITRLLGGVRFFELIHLKAGDFHFLARGKQPTSNVVVLAIDQKSLDHFPELMLFWHP